MEPQAHPSHPARSGAALRAFAALVLATHAACAPIDPEPPVDEDGNELPQPAPFDDWLRLEASAPAPGTETPTKLALRPTVTFRFNDYLDDDTFLSYDTVWLDSGGRRVYGTLRYQMTAKTLVWKARNELEPGLVYRLEFTSGRLRSVTDAPPDIDWSRPRFIADASTTPATTPLPDGPATWDDVAAIFASKCDHCHADPQWQLSPLTPEHLIGARSTQTDRLLVRPLDPVDSYLMHKLLPDYADRHYSVQPPPWDDASTPLTTDELWTIERWIWQGARVP